MSETVDLIAFLNSREDHGWSGGLPATEEEVREAEEELKIRLSDEYRQFLLHHKYGGEVESETGRYFRLYGIDELCGLNPHAVWSQHLPGALFFATDDGERIIYFDAENRVGRGAWAVYVCNMGASFFDTSTYVGRTMQEFIERVLKGEDIVDSPWLQDEGLEFDDAGNRIK